MVTGEDVIDYVFNFLCDLEIYYYKKNKYIDIEVLYSTLKNNFESEKLFIVFDAAIQKFAIFQYYLNSQFDIDHLNNINDFYIKKNGLQNTETEKYILDAFERYKKFKRRNYVN